MRVYLDNCAIQRPYDDQTIPRNRVETEAVLSIIELVEEGRIDLVGSDVLRFEIENCPDEDRKLFGQTILGLAKQSVEKTNEIKKRAEVLVAAGLEPLDAAHIAMAEEAGVDYFCTSDDRLITAADRIEFFVHTLNPLVLVTKLEK